MTKHWCSFWLEILISAIEKGSRLENTREEHFKYCQRQQLDTAKAVEGIDVRHWTDPDLQNVPFYDREHFETGAAPHLLKLLHELFHEAPFKKPETKAEQGNAPFPWNEHWSA